MDQKGDGSVWAYTAISEHLSCDNTLKIYKEAQKLLTLNSFKRFGYNPSPFSSFLHPSTVLHPTLHMHSMLCHALHEHHNPWLISSVNQWDSLIATTKVYGTPMVTQANSISEHHPSHKGPHKDCSRNNSSNTHHTAQIIY